MRLRPDTPAFTLLLAFLTMIGPLSIDVFLPSLPIMARIFHTTPAGMQATITGYFIGFALAQLVYGPISDRIGRRPVLIAGMIAYTAASFLCVIAPGVEALVAARVVQAIAAAAPIILARTIVRDIHAGVRAGNTLSIMSSIMGVVPVLAPALGGFLETSFGWQSSFWVMTIFGAIGVAIVGVALPETIRERRIEPLSLRSIAASYAVVARSSVFRVNAGLVCLAYAGLVIYIGASSFIVQGRYGLSPLGYGFSFAVVAMAFVGGTFIGRTVARRRGLDRAIGVGCAFLAGGGVLLPVALWFGPGALAEFIVPAALYMVGIGVVIPQALAAALTPFPERAGAASSLAGFLHMGTAAVCLAITGAVFSDDAFANVSVLAAAGALALVTYVTTARSRVA